MLYFAVYLEGVNMANELACRQEADCRGELRPSPASEGAEVVELAFSSFDHRFAPLVRELITYILPQPSDREFRKARGEDREELWRRIRLARSERDALDRIVKRVLALVPPRNVTPRLKAGSPRVGSCKRFSHARRVCHILRTLEGEKDWLRRSSALYPTLKAWMNVREAAESAAYEEYFVAHGGFPPPGSEDQFNTDRSALLAGQVLMALIPPEDAELLNV